ncbi:helix-turn-helix transcriptional regulator [Brevibacterium salitolerans]|uniref:HTH deoR-type domain-containing protein n=1 Tax=Brevibacterium salitolerans TaxID=1403566 RepID=A0ABN2X9S6_9MICO
MRASRLLLLLQTRPRITTAELAARLEVSRRTVLRDVEALSAAGVPVYAERGRNGGIVLLPGARLNASHLEPPELEALSVTGLDSEQLERLGLGTAHRKDRRAQDRRPSGRGTRRLGSGPAGRPGHHRQHCVAH